MEEWSQKYNPFNSMKALIHAEYWKQIIAGGVVPPPRLVSIDPCGVCNYRCPHCNANEILTRHNKRMDMSLVRKTAALMKEWKTRAVCIGGGGESLLNPNTFRLVDLLVDAGVEVGVVTNGSRVDEVATLLRCKWVGISVDAATAKTHSTMKGVSENKFDEVIENIRKLTRQGTEIAYKYLLHPNNCHEICEAARVAKDIGCDLIHIRPGAEPWSNAKGVSFEFTPDMIARVKTDVERARVDFEDDSFRIYGVTHKFNPNFSIKKSFKKCYACMTTCLIDSRGMIGLCCDRRGDTKLELCHIEDVHTSWGSREHKRIHEEIIVGRCPRCTYSHVNEIFENVIIRDSMMCNLY